MESKGRWAPPPIPDWMTVAVLLGVGGIVILPSALVLGSGAPMAAAGGLVFGFFATASHGARAGLGPSAIVALACLATLAAPAVWLALAIALGLAALAGGELHRFGTRTMVMALYAFVTFRVALSMGSGSEAYAIALVGIAAGTLAAVGTGLAGILPAAPLPREDAIRMTLFLMVGFVLSFALVHWLDTPRSYWVAFLFVLRCILPYDAQRAGALRFGKGAAIGVVLAVGIEATGVPDAVRLGIALFLAALGTRYLLDPRPIPAAAFSGAVLLGAAPTAADALYRIEAVALVIGLIFVLIPLIDRVRIGGILPAERPPRET